MRRSVGVVLLLLGVVVAATDWVARDWSHAVLASASMEPWASPGDLLVHRHVPAGEIEVGDVVTVRGARDRLVTHRVVQLAGTGDRRVARLQGDRSRLPDPVPVDLRGEVARVEVVVPRLGHVLRVGAPLLWGGVALLAAGGTALVVARRRDRVADVAAGDEAPGRGAGPAGPDPRIHALLATCEQLAEDGVADVVVADVVRVRVAALAGLPSAERAGAVLALDDGARFYVVACADADVDALGLVPVGSQRRHAATAALDVWWDAVADRLPHPTVEVLDAWSPSD